MSKASRFGLHPEKSKAQPASTVKSASSLTPRHLIQGQGQSDLGPNDSSGKLLSPISATSLKAASANALAEQRQTPAFSNSQVSIGFQENQTIETDLKLLLDILPGRIQHALSQFDLNDLIEIVMDLGRPAEARFGGNTQHEHMIEELGSDQVTSDEIHHVVSRIGYFSSENRGGIPRTLHRISAIRNRQNEIIGLTCRVGKVVTGTIDCIKDLVQSGKSILILGRPGIGKTTKLREVAKMMADELRKRVVIVDTSNEIAGDGDIPHPAVGRARRMQVMDPDHQKEIMIEAVQNHTPEVIVVDEIGSEEEAMASRTIAERGVLLVATAHGSTLESLIKNPVLSDLIGGIETVTLGDDEAKRRASQKTVLERAKKPTFDICVELRDRNTLAIYPDVAEAVDHTLRGWTIFPEIRKVDLASGTTKVLKSDVSVLQTNLLETSPDTATPHTRDELALHPEQHEFRVYLFSISKSYVDRILERLNLNHIRVSKSIYDANAVIALKGSARPGSKILDLAKDYEVPVYFAKTNTMPQIQRALREALDAVNEPSAEAFHHPGGVSDYEDETELALQEAQEAIEGVLQSHQSLELAPRRSYIRRLQHELVEQHQLSSESVGDEPNRRLRVLPPKK
ncbi:MAG: R3H domain-containing nucleic acid-binding protein [Vampirovibrionales bacterium]|nr:R3H domain-containing nucleic acid-binding protein [Vampirovibrionales bacterium]